MLWFFLQGEHKIKTILIYIKRSLAWNLGSVFHFNKTFCANRVVVRQNVLLHLTTTIQYHPHSVNVLWCHHHRCIEILSFQTAVLVGSSSLALLSPMYSIKVWSPSLAYSTVIISIKLEQISFVCVVFKPGKKLLSKRICGNVFNTQAIICRAWAKERLVQPWWWT